jgi:tetratricopeptide (TPR) repeat protein
MAQSREIEKLQRRWQENPLGLTFAPLAEAYRKEGLCDDALELLEIGLGQHPNYVPAHIVRGRCYLDAGADAAAEASFLRVVELDPENVIALKGLAEIAERAGRFHEAVQRLERLLSFDRNNDEARLQLERVRSMLVTPSPGTIELEAVDIGASLGRPPLDLPPVAASTLEPEEQHPAEPVDEPASAAEPAEEPAARVFDEAEGPVSLEGTEPGFVAEVLDVTIETLDVVTFEPVELSGSALAQDRVPDDVARAAASHEEAPAPLDREPESAPPVERASEPVWLSEPGPDTEPVAEPVAEPELEPGFAEPAAEEAALSQGAPAPPAGEGEEIAEETELVVTETMAEVFLRQGHRELALAVYTQLAQREGDNPRIRAAIERLGSEFRAAPSGLPTYAAALTGGQSVRSFLEALLTAVPPGAGPGPALGAVFGDEEVAGSEAGGGADREPSYDEFFAETEEPGRPPAAATPDRGPVAPTPAAPAEDIEEFNAWLRGLKR